MSDHTAFPLPEQQVFGAAAAERRDLHAANEPLLPETQFAGVVPTAAERNITDKAFALVLAAASLFWLISGFCSVGSADMTWLNQLQNAAQSADLVQFSVSRIMSAFFGLVVFSCTAACACGFVWIRIVQLYPLKVVSFSFFASIALWLGVLITGISIGSIYLALFGVLMGVFYVFLYIVNKNAIERTATLLHHASRVTNSHPGLIRLMFMAALGVAVVGSLGSWFSVAAYSSGSVIDCSGEADCDDADGWFGTHDATKAFRPSVWSFFVLVFNTLLFYTLINFLHLAQLFVTAYVTSVWYYHSAEEDRSASAIENGVEAAQLQSGTIAVAAFMRAVVETLRDFCERALQLSRKGQLSEQSWLRMVCECLVRSLLRFLEYVADVASRYCTMSAAVTGQAFAPSYRYTRRVLAQNGWKMLTVDALASHTCSTCAGVVGFLVGSIGYAITSAGMHWSNVAHGQSWSIAAAVVSGSIAYAIFQLFACLIVNILDSLYFCFAIDSEENRGRFCRSNEIPMNVVTHTPQLSLGLFISQVSVQVFDSCKAVARQSDQL